MPRPSWNPLNEILALAFVGRGGRDCWLFRVLGMAAAGKNPLWTVAGIVLLVIFALALTRIDAAAVGRAFAA